jgi:hypothetical protein
MSGRAPVVDDGCVRLLLIPARTGAAATLLLAAASQFILLMFQFS